MKWEIKKEYIQKRYYTGTNESFTCLSYLREWNKNLYRKEIKINSISSNSNGVKRMLEAAFDKENNKPTFKKMSLYQIQPYGREYESKPNSLNGLFTNNQTLLLAKKPRCIECGEELNEKTINYCRFGDNIDLLCPKCYKLNNQINKLKE